MARIIAADAAASFGMRLARGAASAARRGAERGIAIAKLPVMWERILQGIGKVVLVSGLLLAAACTPAGDPSLRYTTPNVGYDVTPDSTVAGQYLSSGAYVDGQGVDPQEVRL